MNTLLKFFGFTLAAVIVVVLLLIGPVGWAILGTAVWIGFKVRKGVEEGIEDAEREMEIEELRGRLAKLEGQDTKTKGSRD